MEWSVCGGYTIRFSVPYSLEKYTDMKDKMVLVGFKAAEWEKN